MYIHETAYIHKTAHTHTNQYKPPTNTPQNNRYQLATGGSENVARLWDVRKKSHTYTLPAHSGLISSLKCVSCGESCVCACTYPTFGCVSIDRWQTPPHTPTHFLTLAQSNTPTHVMVAGFRPGTGNSSPPPPLTGTPRYVYTCACICMYVMGSKEGDTCGYMHVSKGGGHQAVHTAQCFPLPPPPPPKSYQQQCLPPKTTSTTS